MRLPFKALLINGILSTGIRTTQQGNFLPYIDRYDISFADKVKGFHKKARLIYEFDPADIMYSYMYPAMARTFRMAGFQWVTQFAYDPMDIAYANTEYQTHFLNLAYTPHKAISMKIAAEAARNLRRGESYGSYPQDTLFGDGFRVSYTENLSERIMEGNTIIPTIPTACPKMLHSLCPLPVAAVLPSYITKEPVHILLTVWKQEYGGWK